VIQARSPAHTVLDAPADPPRKILIVRLSSLGDVIQTLPLPTAIRRNHPEAKIGWAIDTELASAIEGHPHIDYIHRCDRNRWGKALLNPTDWFDVTREIKGFIGEIRAQQYEVAVDAQGRLKSAVVPYAARIPRRIGFAHGREWSGLFYTERYVTRGEYFSPKRHHVSHMLELLKAIGCQTEPIFLELPPSDCAEVKKASAMLRDFRQASKVVALAPFTQWPSKRWPLEHWRHLARRILAETRANVAVIGTSKERTLGEELIASLGEMSSGRVINLAGLTSIRDLYTLFPMISVTIAADTAPLHVATAAGCANSIGLFGSTSPVRLAPLGRGSALLLLAKADLPCRPCRQTVCRFGTTECMRRISPDEVYAELVKRLEAA
jgi:heptosyltransferase-1